MSERTATYISQVKSLLANRPKLDYVGFRTLIPVTVVGILVYIGLALLINPGDYLSYNFRSERGLVTILSAILLSAASAFAFTSFFIATDLRGKDRLFWLVMALALAFFAVDELFEGHEQVGTFFEEKEAWQAWMDQSVFRNWNDVVVILYGVIALVVGLYFLPNVLLFPMVFELLFVAGLFYVLHTAIDSTMNTEISVVFEESAKLYSATFLALAFFAGQLGNMVRVHGSADASVAL